MFVDREAFVVVFGVRAAVVAGEELGGLVGLEPQVEVAVPGGAVGVAETLRGEHQVVVGFEVLRVDAEGALEDRDGGGEVAAEEVEAAELVVRHPVPGERRQHAAQVLLGFVVAAEGLERHRGEEARPGQGRVEGERLLEHGQRALRVAFLDPDAGLVHEGVRVAGCVAGGLGEGCLRRPEVAGEQHPDAVVVEPQRPRQGARRRVLRRARRLRRSAALVRRQHDRRGGHLDDRNHRRGDRFVEAPLPVVVGGGDRGRRRGLGAAAEGPLGVPPLELPVVEARGEGDRAPHLLGHPQAVADGVRGARRDLRDVEGAAGGPGVPLVDRVAPGVEQQGAEEVRRGFDRGVRFAGGAVAGGRVRRVPAFAEEAAPEEGAAVPVVGAELHPDIVGVHRAAREEVPQVPGAHHHIHPHRLPGNEPRPGLVEGGGQGAGRTRRGVPRGGGGGFFADGEGRGEGQRVGAARGDLRRPGDLVVPGEGEEVHGHLAGGEEVAHRLQLPVEAEVRRQRGVRRGEAVGAEEPVPGRRILAGDERHVAVGAGAGFGGVVEGAGALAGDAARLPVVVTVEAPEPAVVVHRLVEVHLVAGGAEGGTVAGVERLQERLPVRFGVEVEHQVVEGAQQRVPRGGEVVHLRVLEDEAGVPGGVLDPGHRMAGHAGEAGARRRGVHDLRQRAVHEPGEQHRVVVAAGAPLGGGDADHALHVLDGAAVPGVVEGGEAVRRLAPLLGEVGVASRAGLALQEEVLGDEAAVRGLGGAREEGAVRPAHRLPGHRRRREPGVQQRPGRGEEFPESAAEGDGRPGDQRGEEQPPTGEEGGEPGGGGEVREEQRARRRGRAEDDQAEAGEGEDPAGEEEQRAQPVGAEGRAEGLPSPEGQLERRDPEDRVQQDLRGVEEARLLGGEQVAGVEREEPAGGQEQPSPGHRSASGGGVGATVSTPASRSARRARRVIRTVAATAAASPAA